MIFPALSIVFITSSFAVGLYTKSAAIGAIVYACSMLTLYTIMFFARWKG